MKIKELGDYTMFLEGEWVYRWYEELKMSLYYFLSNPYELIFRVTDVDTGMRDVATHYLPTGNHFFDTSNPNFSWVENAWDIYKKLHDSFEPRIIPLTINEVGDYSIYVKENLLGIPDLKIKNYRTHHVLATEDGGSVLYFNEKLDDSLKMYNVIYAKIL